MLLAEKLEVTKLVAELEAHENSALKAAWSLDEVPAPTKEILEAVYLGMARWYFVTGNNLRKVSGMKARRMPVTLKDDNVHRQREGKTLVMQFVGRIALTFGHDTELLAVEGLPGVVWDKR